MQLSSLLRPEKVKAHLERKEFSHEEDLFKIYDADLKHQLYDNDWGIVYLPISYEGLDGDHVCEDEMSQLFDAVVDSEAVAEQVVSKLKDMGWKVDSYVEDGSMVINLEEPNDQA